MIGYILNNWKIIFQWYKLLLPKSLLIDENLEIVTSKIKAEALKVNDSINSLNQNWQSKTHSRKFESIGGNDGFG